MRRNDEPTIEVNELGAEESWTGFLPWCEWVKNGAIWIEITDDEKEMALAVGRFLRASGDYVFELDRDGH